MAKSKVIALKNGTNWADFNLKTRCLVRAFIFIIISTWCVYHVAHYVLQLDKAFEPKWPKTIFSAPDVRAKVFLKI